MNTFNDFTMAVGKAALPIMDTAVRMPFGVSRHLLQLKGYQDDPITLELIEPSHARTEIPAILYFHGGGFGYDAAPYHYKLAALYAKEANCRVIMPHYHQLPEYPFPAALIDGLKCLQFLANHGKRIRVDTARIAVMGDSAGGALAACVCNFSYQTIGYTPCGQMLIYPVCDASMMSDSMTELKHPPVWNPQNNAAMWEKYLAADLNANQIKYASPMANPLPEIIPETFIEVAEKDCLRDEGIAYAKRLERAGATVYLSKPEGTWHAYDQHLYKDLTQRNLRRRVRMLRSFFDEEPYVLHKADYHALKRHYKQNHNKIYKGIRSIPDGHAEGELIEGCLVIEGGAFRGLYAEGVLDVLMQNGINISTVIGVSAGALNGMQYAARQIGRAARINLQYRKDHRWVGEKALLKNRGLVGFNFAFEGLEDSDPFDMESFREPGRRFIAVSTDIEKPETVYAEYGQTADIYQAVRASASMPYVTEPVDVDGRKCLDGGCSVNTPYQWALDQNFEKILVIRSRGIDFRKPDQEPLAERVAPFMYRKHPDFIAMLQDGNLRYNRECEDMERLAAEGRIYMLNPSGGSDVGNLEPDLEKLGDFYYIGRQDALEHLDEIKAYLGID